MLLLLLQRQARLSSDALLGLLAHATLAVGLVVLAFMTWVRVDLMGFLFGDILAINKADIITIWVGGLAVLIALAVIWKSLFAATVNYEIAVAEGRRRCLQIQGGTSRHLQIRVLSSCASTSRFSRGSLEFFPTSRRAA